MGLFSSLIGKKLICFSIISHHIDREPNGFELLIFLNIDFIMSFRACAEQALSILNGTQLGGQSIRLSWGRSPSNKQVF